MNIKIMDAFVDIKGYEGLYQINKKGDVYSFYSKKILKPYFREYYRIDLCKNGVKYKHYIHRLLAYTFLPLIEGKNTVNHKNGIKIDNRLENIEFVTDKENSIHAVKTGLQRKTNNNDIQLTEEDIINIYNDNRSDYKLALLYKVSRATITEIKSGKTWNWLTNDVERKPRKNNNYKYTKEFVELIKQDKRLYKDISAEYGIAMSTVSFLKNTDGGKYRNNI